MSDSTTHLTEAIGHIYKILEHVLVVQEKQEHVLRDMSGMIERLAGAIRMVAAENQRLTEAIQPKKFEFALQVEYRDHDLCEHQTPHTTHQNGVQ